MDEDAGWGDLGRGTQSQDVVRMLENGSGASIQQCQVATVARRWEDLAESTLWPA